MSDQYWVMPGASLSLKNACNEYAVTEIDIVNAMREGKLNFRKNYAHGNPYYKLLRGEVEALVNNLYGSDHVKKTKKNHKIKKINSEINSLKRKIRKLEKEKADLTRE